MARGRRNAVEAPGLSRGVKERVKPLSKEFLLKRGYCCNNGCKNCPYRETIMKEKKDKWIGWVIVVLAIVFLYLCIDPWRNDREEFIRIISMVLGGGVGATLIIMWTLQRYLPNDEDPYEDYIKEEFDNEKLDK